MQKLTRSLWMIIPVSFLLFLPACTTVEEPAPIETVSPVVLSSETAPAIVDLAPPVQDDGSITIPGGIYVLGSDVQDSYALPHEIPQHKVEITGFRILRSEVTYQMYQACVSAGACLTPAVTPGITEDMPVVGVDWFMASDYCRWYGGRLPTEAEWEAAARGMGENLYPWGTAPADCTTTAMSGCGKEAIPFQVGSFPAGNTNLGGSDFAGNAWEWVNDWYDANYYKYIADVDPVGPWSGTYKVIRGGGWNSTAGELRTANRAGIDPAAAFNDVGFRCVLDAAEVSGVSGADPLHRVLEGGESVEPELRGYREPDDLPRAWSWGNPVPLCGLTAEGLVYLPADNNFGGTYGGTHDGSQASCAYDGSRSMLMCSFTLEPAGGSAGHDLRFFITQDDGTPVSGSEYAIRLPDSAYASCQGEEPNTNQAVITAAAHCNPEGTASLALTSAVPAMFNSISVRTPSATLEFTDPASECLAVVGFADCPLAGMTGPASVEGNATLIAIDGVTRFTGSFSGEVPACSQQSNTPALVLQSICNQSGTSRFVLSSTPSESLLISLSSPASCTTSSSPAVRWDCLTPPVSSDGLVHLDLACSLASDPATGVPVPEQVFLPADCPQSPEGQAALLFGQPSCRPGGLPGAVTTVQFVGPAGAAEVRVNTGGTLTPCSSATSSSRAFTCELPIPLPADLQFCAALDGVSVLCQPNPYASSALPAQCGSQQGSAIWTVMPACLPQGASGFDLAVSISGGPSVLAVNASTGSGDVPCGADPSTSDTFHCAVTAASPEPAVSLTATLVDGSTISHTYDGLTTFVPEQCNSSNTPTTPGSGSCADDASVSSWNHPGLPADVNNDGCVTARDVLLIINRINSFGSGPLSSPRPAGAGFFDVNGDGALSPVDVLLVINYLNTHTGETCTPGCTPRALPGNTARITCTGQTPVLAIQVDAGNTIDTVTLNGTSPAAGDCSGMGTSLATCLLPRELTDTRVDLLVSGRYSDGTGYILRYELMPPVCQLTVAPTTKPHQATCADYSPNECEQNGCYLVNGTCQSTPGSQTCTSYTDKSTCLANGCTWDGQQCTQ